jgi:zinc/manganese transport system permease protein
MLYEAFIAPFAEFEFMRRALAGAFALALGAGPIGVFLMLRRMSLVGDAMAHAILPGAAIGFLISGLNLFAIAAGGLIAGFIIALAAGLIARATELKEDASLAAFFLISLAVGVTIVSIRGSNIDLLRFLFGSVLALDDPTLFLIAANATISLAFLALVVINLISGFHALGTLLAVGIMMLPAIAARFWARDITTMITIAVAVGAVSGYAGLLLSYHASFPSGPAIILVAGTIYGLSVLFGRVDGLVRQMFPGRHLEA